MIIPPSKIAAWLIANEASADLIAVADEIVPSGLHARLDEMSSVIVDRGQVRVSPNSFHFAGGYLRLLILKATAQGKHQEKSQKTHHRTRCSATIAARTASYGVR